jgi:hypothetical protein
MINWGTVKSKWSKIGHWYQGLAISSILVLALLIGGIAWYYQSYSNPTNAFWGMVGNNLSVMSISKKSAQKSQQVETTTLTRVSFTPTPQIHFIKEITDNSVSPSAKLTVEAIGTPQADYQRYSKVERVLQTGKKVDYSSIYNLWLKNPNAGGRPQLVGSSLFGSMLFGNLPASSSEQVMSKLHKAYSPHFSKEDSYNGRKSYDYFVDINLRAYASAVKTYATMIGLKAAAPDPNSYPISAKVTLRLSLDVLSRQLVKTEYKDVDGSTEYYSGYGISTPAEIPTQIATVDQFQRAIQKATP